ncbi:DUF4345 domain-containing protein [Fibrella forsythiae]|uniref:DUF4345 family protein n=1 Tax=Fibrella forsythiae TaxID=2817061 RepID=A0ABS3JUD4_9BACT|nr:DUF4345 domain-containing protein [Fibrella forsythiae]MBO0952517.1 DUF4345 family protein [Fibrella forsythiae]
MIRFLSITLIGVVAAGIGLVALMAFMDPQAVMNLVQVKLPNTDAYSSIRGVYGGAGLTIVTVLLFLAITDVSKGLLLTAILCGFYALSRIATSQIEGPLGAFGRQWLLIESSIGILALLLWWARSQEEKNTLRFGL